MLNSSTDNVQEAVIAAKQADLVIVVAGTTTGESVDRDNLSLDNDADSLIAAVSATGKQIVVLTQICGAIVMPWRGQVSGILSLFLGGQETGSAWADVLFGDVAPIGHLPLMMPESEADQIAPANEAGEITGIPYTGSRDELQESEFQGCLPVRAWPHIHHIQLRPFQGTPLRWRCLCAWRHRQRRRCARR